MTDPLLGNAPGFSPASLVTCVRELEIPPTPPDPTLVDCPATVSVSSPDNRLPAVVLNRSVLAESVLAESVLVRNLPKNRRESSHRLSLSTSAAKRSSR